MESSFHLYRKPNSWKFYKTLRKENAKKDSDVDFGNENSFEEQNVITPEADNEKQTKGQDENIAEFK